MYKFLECLDSEEMANQRRSELSIPRHVAQQLAASAVVAIRAGRYFNDDGMTVDWSGEVETALASKVSIPPDRSLAQTHNLSFDETRVQVTNETTLGAARRLFEEGKKPIALNFANGVQPGGGFLSGALAQEESLCRSSALFATLENDPMYDAHRGRPLPDSTDWCIYSSSVPVFRSDNGNTLDSVWPLSFLTCAAPVANRLPSNMARSLMAGRIKRVLDVCLSYGYSELILGAWGCGAFGHDPLETAESFRDILETQHPASFSEIVFAIADWSTERRFIGPFRDVFR